MTTRVAAAAVSITVNKLKKVFIVGLLAIGSLDLWYVAAHFKLV